MTQAKDPWIGKQFGKYLIKRCIGVGGMGIVYEGEDVLLLRPVALKILPDQHADRDRLRRFQREAQAAARLTHPNVVAVYDIGVWDKACYIAMELVRGESLQQIVDRRGPLPWREAVVVAIEVCRGLIAAHEAGLIHRDIKPANILRAEDGAVKIADFGVARINADNFPRLTVLNGTVGTPAFMSPEQCRGQKLDPRTDLYSLGATLYVLVTGDQPFHGAEEVAILSAHCSAPIPDPRALRPDVPAACSDLIRKAMAKTRDERQASATQMHQALTRLLDEAPAASATSVASAGLTLVPRDHGEDATVRNLPLVTDHAGRPRKRWLLVAGLLPVAMLVLTLVALLWRDASLAVVPAVKQVDQPPEPARKPEGGPIGLRFAKKWKAHDAGVAALAFSPTGERLYSGSGDASVRCWTGDTEIHRWNFAKKIHALALAPDEKTVAAGGDEGKLFLWEPPGEQLGTTIRIQGGEAVNALAFSPAGDLLAVGIGGGFQVWGREPGEAFKRRYVYPKPQYNVAGVAFAPDGKSAAWVNFQREVHVIHVPGWQSRGDGFNQAGSLNAVAFTLDGQGIFYGGLREGQPNGVLMQWDLGGGQHPKGMEPPCLVRALALSPGGGTLVAAGAWGGPLHLYDLATRRARVAPTRSNSAIHALCFSPDGKLLAAGCDNGDIQTWDVAPLKE